MTPLAPGKRLSRDAYLLCFSAFFADLGYQGVAALFPLDIVFRLHAPVFAYGIVTAVAFGGGSLFSYIGGLAGDRFDRKAVAILGNTFIPLMALSGIVHGLWPAAALFILGWWARYFRTPARRALLVNVTRPEERGMAFGFLHALDIGGGMLSALAALLFLYAGGAIGTIMLFAVLPLLVSTGLLFFVRRTELHPAETPRAATGPRDPGGRALLIALLVSATLYGFSFYNLGFPILSATGGHATRAGYEYGVLAFMIYLGVSAVSGYALGAGRLSAVRSVWLFGYLPSALGSGLIGLSELLQLHAAAFYLSVAVLGFGMGRRGDVRADTRVIHRGTHAARPRHGLSHGVAEHRPVPVQSRHGAPFFDEPLPALLLRVGLRSPGRDHLRRCGFGKAVAEAPGLAELRRFDALTSVSD